MPVSVATNGKRFLKEKLRVSFPAYNNKPWSTLYNGGYRQIHGELYTIT